MAYSDYGGYAYRNGDRIPDRSDAVITADMTNLGEEGAYPGFVAIAKGMSAEQFEEARAASVDGHVVLGDGPVLIAMYKQTSFSVHVLSDGKFTIVDLLEAGKDLPDAAISEYDGKRHFSSWNLANKDVGKVQFEVAGHQIEALFEESDNYYQFARLTQPDGVVWTGFSGYGVGAGLEDCGYGYSTSRCARRLAEVFPSETPGKPSDATRI